MKVNDLTGPMLDLFVGMADGQYVKITQEGLCVLCHSSGKRSGKTKDLYAPSADWQQGGPLIKREKIMINPIEDEMWGAAIELDTVIYANGPTPLIAAMRAFVYSKFGEEVPSKQEAK